MSWLVVVRRLVEGDDRSLGPLFDPAQGYPHRAFDRRARGRLRRSLSLFQQLLKKSALNFFVKIIR